MPYNGTGVFTGLTPPTYPAVAGTVIDPDYFNAIMADVFGGLTNAVTRNGQSPATVNLPMGGFKHTGCANATANDQYVTLGQLSSVVVDVTANYTWTGLHTWKRGTGTDPGILISEATACRLAFDTVVGGTPGTVKAPAVIDHRVNLGTDTFEWSFLARNSNYSSGVAANDCVGVYSQAYKYTNGARSWGLVSEVQDKSGNSGAGILCGLEIDVMANGTVGATSRLGAELVFGKGTTGGAQNLTDVGIRFSPFGSDRSQAALTKGLEFNIDCVSAIIKLQNSLDAKYFLEFEDADNVRYLLRMKSAGSSMYIPSGLMTTLGGGFRCIVDTYEYMIPFYGFVGATGPIPM